METILQTARYGRHTDRDITCPSGNSGDRCAYWYTEVAYDAAHPRYVVTDVRVVEFREHQPGPRPLDYHEERAVETMEEFASLEQATRAAVRRMCTYELERAEAEAEAERSLRATAPVARSAPGLMPA